MPVVQADNHATLDELFVPTSSDSEAEAGSDLTPRLRTAPFSITASHERPCSQSAERAGSLRTTMMRQFFRQSEVTDGLHSQLTWLTSARAKRRESEAQI